MSLKRAFMLTIPPPFLTLVNVSIAPEQPLSPHSTFRGEVNSVLPPESGTIPPVPDNPPWGVFAAAMIWLASVLLMVLFPLLAVLPYILSHISDATIDINKLTTDPHLIFLQVAAILPTHLATFALIWILVTRAGKRPFLSSLGWSWSPGFGFYKAVVVAILLLVVGVLITKLVGGGETQLDQIIASSAASRYTVAFLATFTGPFVEELVYRGVLYSALQRAIGVLWSVITVSVLFTSMHVLQYKNNIGAVAVVFILALALGAVRARTGRLLPAYIIHLIFNGFQAAVLLLEPYFEHLRAQSEHASGLLLFHHLLR